MPAAGATLARGGHAVSRSDCADGRVVPKGGRTGVVGLTDVQRGCQKRCMREALGRCGRGAGDMWVGDFHEAPFNGMYCVPMRHLSGKPFCMTEKHLVHGRVVAFVINAVINSRVQKSSVFEESGPSLRTKLIGRKSSKGV